MKISIEAEGYRMDIDEDMFESFGLSIPSDITETSAGQVVLGRTHIALTGMFKEGVRPEWKEIHE